ncbi:hypothetical protein TSTA_053110 [Talaromyces stipitatus ATCC 10500]|uniref:Tc1-like transposase DDE domain-containing protein n=1 Tax=Talaromyces stipitatus (strain ATCC 10500 / CBS 375.48 / QM 6759 / NRRL 1006) TaxID=441959 RepID=B8MQV8_TALSN|nr:uncharacterized protein TSTA_053110 [Talaromyces stipitatus ATCC 10500]EED12793.1 hypothetical protein TSTA_053110 [Talaromyces stipitatus ATCC 10500]
MALVQISQFHRGQRYQILPAYAQDGIVLTRVFQGSTDASVFGDFTEQLLQSVLVMDNASFHHTDRIYQICTDAEVKLIYLPPYSQDLNPIEEFFAELKAFIKRNWRLYEEVPEQGFDAFLEWCVDLVGTREESAKGHFRHAGVIIEDSSKEPTVACVKDQPPPGMGELNKYTVGWICAITTEYVAARAFLDKEHESLEYGFANDNNIYALGEMGKHNVVIARLPKGEYGIAAAASVARDMVRSFPNIRIGLMVGIGGGAPSKWHDIRLGDIVVSAPHNGKGGLFQYDFGKTIQDQEFRTTGFLDQPPGLLRAAIGDIEAEYEMNGHRLDEAIDSVLKKRPKLRKKYKRPEPGTDRLY